MLLLRVPKNSQYKIFPTYISSTVVALQLKFRSMNQLSWNVYVF